MNHAAGTQATPNWDEMVLVGRIARPQGHLGQVVVNPVTDFPDERFAPGAVLHTLREGRVERLTVVAMRMHQGRPVLTLEDLGTMNDARALAGAELRVPETELATLPEGTYYEHDLVGCVLVTRIGRELGTVRAVEGGGGTTRLVAGSGRGEIQVPLVHDICVRIDIEEKRIVIEPPEGLLDLNA